MKDSLLLMKIHRHLLITTSKLIEILEHHTEKSEKDISPELKEKYKEFKKHAHQFIQNMNEDLHLIIKLDTEVKDLENNEKEI